MTIKYNSAKENIDMNQIINKKTMQQKFYSRKKSNQSNYGLKNNIGTKLSSAVQTT